MKKISCLILALSLVIVFADVTLAKKKKKKHKTDVQKVMIEQKYHHLGDDILSSFIIPEYEGTLWESSFKVRKSTLKKANTAFAKFLSHNLDITDLIVNGQHIALDSSYEQFDQHFVNYVVPLPLHLFYPGKNTIGFEVIEEYGNYDDMEFGELEIWFQK